MKFEVGEICEARSWTGAYAGWREVEILEAGPLRTNYGKSADYKVSSTGHPKEKWYPRGLYAREEHLRKKRPPEQKDNHPAEESFDDLMRQLNKDMEVA